MSDPYEDLACEISKLRDEIMQEKFGILQKLIQNITQLRDEIIELTGAIYEASQNDR